MEKGELDSGRVWFVQSEDQVTFGLTDLAISQLGEITSIEISELDESVRSDDILFSIEGTKQNYEFVSPVEGVVSETNEVVMDDPSVISDDPADSGWILKMEVTDGEIEGTEPSMIIDASNFKKVTKKSDSKKSKSTPKPKAKTRKIGKNDSKKRKKK